MRHEGDNIEDTNDLLERIAKSFERLEILMATVVEEIQLARKG